jgi:antitoxin CcdA
MRKSTSMNLDGEVIAEAKALGINLSKAAENGIANAIKSERARMWKSENAGAITDYNDMIASAGVPLSQFRKF